MGSATRKRSRKGGKKRNKAPARSSRRIWTVPGFQVAWANQQHRTMTRGSGGVRDYATEIVKSVEEKIPADYRWIIHNLSYRADLVNVDEGWAVQQGSRYSYGSLVLNAPYFVKRAGRREELMWAVGVVLAQIYVDTVTTYARIGYRAARGTTFSYSKDPSDWNTPGHAFSRRFERVIGTHGGRSGKNGLAKAIARSWLREVYAPRLDCLRCTDDGLVEKQRCPKPVPADAGVTPPDDKVDAAKLAAALTSMQGLRDQAANKAKEDTDTES